MRDHADAAEPKLSLRHSRKDRPAVQLSYGCCCV
jgi:hypothetical protein